MTSHSTFPISFRSEILGCGSNLWPFRSVCNTSHACPYHPTLQNLTSLHETLSSAAVEGPHSLKSSSHANGAVSSTSPSHIITAASLPLQSQRGWDSKSAAVPHSLWKCGGSSERNASFMRYQLHSLCSPVLPLCPACFLSVAQEQRAGLYWTPSSSGWPPQPAGYLGPSSDYCRLRCTWVFRRFKHTVLKLT